MLNTTVPSSDKTGTLAARSSTAALLIVDDSPTMRLYLRHLLQKLFPLCTLLEAEDGKTALRNLSNARIDLIITDLQMPGMDGQSLVQLLRRNPVLRKKPILVVSAALDENVRRDLADLGTDGIACLAKPVDADSLQDSILQLLV
jgi:two-component system chemotaxis response regulator CheY